MSCCITLGISVGHGSGISKMFKFYDKDFNLMGKALSGKLFCIDSCLGNGCHNHVVQHFSDTAISPKEKPCNIGDNRAGQ